MRSEAKASRNQEIYARHQAGKAYHEIAQAYGLRPNTVEEIIYNEKYRLEVSTEKFYRQLRASTDNHRGGTSGPAAASVTSNSAVEAWPPKTSRRSHRKIDLAPRS